MHFHKNKHFAFILIFSSLMCFICACKVQPKVQTEPCTYNVELKDKYDFNYFKEAYPKYTFEAIKKSNRTLNQYYIKLNLSSSKCEELITTLKADSNVIEVIERSESLSPPSQSTNQSKGTASPKGRR